MARFTAEAIYKKMGETRFLPLFNYADVEVCRQVISAAYRAGLRCFELTNRDVMALDVFRQLVPWVEQECPELSLGAGTILDEETAEQFMEAGADFIVAPVFDKSTAKACRKRNVPYIPGCLTPTEMVKAYNAGSPVIKLFPAGTVGPDYVKHVLAPLPHLRLVVTGGVGFEQSEIQRWFDAGVFAMGVGSSVFSRSRVASKDFAGIEAELRRIRG